MMIRRISVTLLYFNWHKHEATKSMYSKGNSVDFLNGKLCLVKRELKQQRRRRLRKLRLKSGFALPLIRQMLATF